MNQWLDIVGKISSNLTTDLIEMKSNIPRVNYVVKIRISQSGQYFLSSRQPTLTLDLGFLSDRYNSHTACFGTTCLQLIKVFLTNGRLVLENIVLQRSSHSATSEYRGVSVYIASVKNVVGRRIVTVNLYTFYLYYTALGFRY
jgi:hypothetical protein